MKKTILSKNNSINTNKLNLLLKQLKVVLPNFISFLQVFFVLLKKVVYTWQAVKRIFCKIKYKLRYCKFYNLEKYEKKTILKKFLATIYYLSWGIKKCSDKK